MADVSKDIGGFVSAIDSLAWTLTTSVEALNGAQESTSKDLERQLTKALPLFKAGSDRFQDALHVVLQSLESMLRMERIHVAQEEVPKSFLVALVSQFDAYLGNLLKSLFSLRPELLESSERSLTFAELSKFGSLEKARDFVLEKEVEAFLRKSHVEQFMWLERKFGLSLRTDLATWPTFVELTERRNLYVHTGGAVSSQYLEVCAQHGVDISDITVGEKTEITPSYFEAAHEAVYEIGVKLGQVLWRKLVPGQTKAAEDVLQSLTYQLLVERRYKLASALLTFADVTLQKRHTSERVRLTFLINRSLAYYLAGDKDCCLEILDGQDWSATSDMFRLAQTVLREQFDNAAELMAKIGAQNRPMKAEYLNWPLFTEFRKTPQFEKAFKDLYGEVTEDDLNLAQEDKKPTEGDGTSNLS